MQMIKSPVLPLPACAEIRRPVLSGQWLVAAIWFPADWYDKDLRHARILAHWRQGARAYRFAQGDLLCFAAPQLLDCGTLPGWPLQRLGQGLCSAQLQESELATLAHADVWLVVAGRLEALYMRDARLLDPSSWLDLHGLSLLDAFDCSNVVPEAALLIPDTGRSVREVLGDAIPSPSAEQQAYLRGEKESEAGWGVVFAIYALRLVQYCFWLGAALAWLAGFSALFDAAGSRRQGATYPATPVTTGQDAEIWFWVLLAPLFILAVLGLKRHVVRTLRQFAKEVEPAAADAVSTTASAPTSPTGGAADQASPPQQASAGWNSGEHAGEGNQGRVAQSSVGVPSSTPAKGRRGKFARLLPARVQMRVEPEQWRNWMVRLAKTTLVSKLLAQQQGNHLGRVMALFESGQLDEALRNAIPLGGDQKSLGQAFATPQRRSFLNLSTHLGPAASIHLDDDMNTRLRQIYRKSFEQLDRKGLVDEAVFVLAELLNSRAEALDYLEKHQRHAQAAELALAWQMPAATIVRLRCLAGDWRMAVAVARRDNAFAAAVNMLDQKWPDAARRLRLEWGEYLAAQGDWLLAVDAVWSIEAARERAKEWLLCAERNGGELAARVLVQRAVLLADTLSSYADQIQGLRDDSERHAERGVIVQTILALNGPTGSAPRLARLLLPAVLLDQANGVGLLNKKSLQRLFSLAGDPFFQADLPSSSLPVAAKSPAWQSAQAITCTPPAAGSQAIFDAVPLNDGRYLVALGEVGAVVIDRFGRTLFRFAVPAEQLVIAESRLIALALARRGEVWRVSRLDLAQRSVVELGVLTMEHCAREFDGVAWTLVSKGLLRVLDTQHDLNTVLWQVTDLPGKVQAMSANSRLEQVLISSRGARQELWRYRMPQRTLAGRDQIEDLADKEFVCLAPGFQTMIMGAESNDDGTHSFYYRYSGLTRRFPLPEVKGQLVRIDFSNGWMTFEVESDSQEMSCLLVRIQDAQCRAKLSWPGRSLVCRIVGEQWLVFDEAGRLFHLDLESGKQTLLTL